MGDKEPVTEQLEKAEWLSAPWTASRAPGWLYSDTDSIPPAQPPPTRSHKGCTLNTTSTTQASSELSKHNVQNHGRQHLSVRLFFVMEGAGLSQESQEKTEGGGEKEGGRNERR